MGRRKSERSCPSHEIEKLGVGPPGQPRWKLLLLALIVALLVWLVDFNAIGGFQGGFSSALDNGQAARAKARETIEFQSFAHAIRCRVAKLGVDAFVVDLEQERRDDRDYGDPAYGTEAIFVPHAQVGPEPHQIHGGSPSLF